MAGLTVLLFVILVLENDLTLRQKDLVDRPSKPTLGALNY